MSWKHSEVAESLKKEAKDVKNETGSAADSTTYANVPVFYYMLAWWMWRDLNSQPPD